MKKKARNIHAGDMVSFTGKREDAARVIWVVIYRDTKNSVDGDLMYMICTDGEQFPSFSGDEEIHVYRKLW